ncbi:hypothetical protein BD410DRAFT_846104 [Rickenella mellea]|uniref:Uncharacterized protein n=1 Tax=Rickenella mellea TaxID=50990 RepID=A0A4Y7PIW7_9AGAM|nr:hypothetical protein BD410DRAFT_846104 [Rickenella mellea]
MARPRKYKTEKEQVEAARKRRRDWYDRESAKSLARYHHLKSVDFEPKFTAPRTHIPSHRDPSPTHEDQLDKRPQAHANSDDSLTSAMHAQLNTQAMLAAAQDAMCTWQLTTANVDHKIFEAQRVFDLWTCGSLRTWGSALYHMIELNADSDSTQAETELQPYVNLGKELQDRFEIISRRSFTCDPSGVGGTWNAAQFSSSRPPPSGSVNLAAWRLKRNNCRTDHPTTQAVIGFTESGIIHYLGGSRSSHILITLSLHRIVSGDMDEPQPGDANPSATPPSPPLPFHGEDNVPTPVHHETAIHPWDTDYWNDMYPPNRPAHLRHIPVYPHISPSPPDAQAQFDRLYPPSQPSQYHISQLPQNPSSPSPSPLVEPPTDFDVDITSRRFRTSRANGDTIDAEQIVLCTRQSSSPRGLPRGPPVTVVFKGAAFLTHFKRVLPTFLENRITFYDDINITIRSRLAAAIVARSFDTPPPSFGGIVSIPQLAILVTAIVEQHGGAGLISSFSWRTPHEIIHTDVIATSVLRRYLDDDAAVRAGNIFDEIEDDDGLPELKDFDFGHEDIEQFSGEDFPTTPFLQHQSQFMCFSLARPLKRRAASDVDDPPARLPPPPSSLALLPAASINTFPFDSAISRIPLDIDKSSLRSPISASQISVAELVASPPNPLSAISIPSTVNSLPPSSPPAPLSPIEIASTIGSFPPSSPARLSAITISSSIDSFLASSPPAPFTITHTNGPSPSSPAASSMAAPTADTTNDDSDFNPCDGKTVECLATNSPRLDLILPCIRYINDIIILHTTTTKLPTRWSFTGGETTYILHGVNFVESYNKSLPKLYSPFVRLRTDDILPMALRRRINRALPLSMKPRHKPTGLPKPLSTLSHMAAVLLRDRHGSELVTTYSWLEPRALNTIDIVPKTLLDRHVELAHAYADGTTFNSSDSDSHFTSSDPAAEELPDHAHLDL